MSGKLTSKFKLFKFFFPAIRSELVLGIDLKSFIPQWFTVWHAHIIRNIVIHASEIQGSEKPKANERHDESMNRTN